MFLKAISSSAVLAAFTLLSPSSSAQAIIAGHEAAGQFDVIPASYFSQVRSEFNFFYGHTSHGSQIMTGIYMLETENATLYEAPSFYEMGDDLGHNGDLTWVAPTENYLDTHPECNVVMWSWCGGGFGQF